MQPSAETLKAAQNQRIHFSKRKRIIFFSSKGRHAFNLKRVHLKKKNKKKYSSSGVGGCVKSTIVFYADIIFIVLLTSLSRLVQISLMLPATHFIFNTIFCSRTQNIMKPHNNKSTLDIYNPNAI